MSAPAPNDGAKPAQPGADLPFGASAGRAVVLNPGEVIGRVLLGQHAVGVVVRIAVASSVAESGGAGVVAVP